MKLSFIDSHCHLNMLQHEELDIFIKRAIENNVDYLQTICTKLSDIPFILEIIDKYPNIFGSVGIHPDEISDLIKYTDLKSFSEHPKIIGLGETGLDYYRAQPDKKNQKESFVTHINVAQETKLPLIVHTRDAEEDTIDVIISEMRNENFTGLIHCFTASKNLAVKMLDIGFYISFSGIISFKNATELQEIVRFVPLERILIETDSPYLAPVPMRGKQNEPSFVKYVAEQVAYLKGLSLEQVALSTTNNFRTLFPKV